MTTVQRAAQIFGIVFLLVGIAGFFVTGTSMAADIDTAPRLLGLFPLNLLHNVVHLLFGVWGLMASRSFDASRGYARIGGIAYLALALLGIVAPNGFGLVPLGSHDVWLHALLGIALAAVGFTARDVARSVPGAPVA
jgi:hypothetical protein